MDASRARPWLRDGVDVYLSSDQSVHFVFLATRKRVRIKAHPCLIRSLEWLDGRLTVAELESKYHAAFGDDIPEVPALRPFLDYLALNGIAVEKDWMRAALSDIQVERHERQLNYFLDLTGSTQAAIALLEKISSTRIAIFGLGAVGSWILLELAQLGFSKFILVDPSCLDDADFARVAFYSQDSIGRRKVDLAKELVHSFEPAADIITWATYLNVDSDLSHLLAPRSDIIINTADEPYLGATSVKLSRYCVKERVPLLAAGGFDAHLGSLGELILPGHTPCADCYSSFFRQALREWHPFPHPVRDRSYGAGGLATLAVFSASASIVKLLRLLAGLDPEVEGGRGEMMFENYEIDHIEISRDPDCPVCGEH